MKMVMVMMSCMVALLAAAGCASSAGSKMSSAEKLTLLNGAKVDVADAIKTALTKVPGRVVDTELHSKNGKTVWEIDIVGPDNKVVEVDVDATTGAVSDSE